MNLVLRLAAAGTLAAPLLILSGCGMEASPQPPTLKIPQQVVNLSGERAGDEVRLRWMMPRRDTDKVLLKGDQKVRVCRRVGSGACEVAVDLLAAPGAQSSAVDHLPSRLTSGQPQLLVYTLLLTNRTGHDAGPSNPVYVASGAAPERMEGVTAQASPDGVVLRWKAAGDTELIRIHRTLIDVKVDVQANAKVGAKADANVDAKESKKPEKGQSSPLPVEQTLEVDGPDKGQALDRDAVLDHTYRYTVERVRKLTLDGQATEGTSEASEQVTVDARDIFPPHVPEGVQAVADPEAHAIDLSWVPDSEADIAGYIVYRREAGAAGNPVKVSPPDTVSPSFRDASTLAGHRYAYSVSAIDHDGNESARSAEVEEELPQQ